MIVKDLSKQQALDSGPKAIQQNNFTGNLDWDGNKITSFITEERNYFGFFTRNHASIVNLFCFNIISI